MVASTGDGTANKRVRDPAAKRAAILSAARQVFRERGYNGATIRAIAQRAGVGHGLVMLHFGSKEELFLQAVPGTRDVSAHLTDDPTELPRLIAHNFVARMEAAEPTDPFIALIRSATTDAGAADKLLLAMQQHTIDTYRQVLDVNDLEQRVALLGAHMVGVTFARYILTDGPMVAMTAEQFTRKLETVARAILLD